MATKTKKSTSSTRSKKKATGTKSASVKADMPILRQAKATGWLAILESLVVGVLGALLIINPEGITRAIFYVAGIFLIIKGIYKIVNYFAIHGKYDFYNNDLLYGIIALVFGVICVICWGWLSEMLGIVVGAWMTYGSLVRMNTAIKMHAAGIKEWFYVLMLSMVMLALGIYMIVSVGAVVTLIGWLMIAAAVVGILDDIIFVQHLDAVTQ